MLISSKSENSDITMSIIVLLLIIKWISLSVLTMMPRKNTKETEPSVFLYQTNKIKSNSSKKRVTQT